MPQITRASLYVDDGKLAECNTSSLSINNNSDRADGQDGVLAVTDGNQHFDFTFDQIIIDGLPGASKTVIDAILQQKEVQLSFLFGGKLISCPAKFQRGDIKSSNQNGSLMGSFTAINSGPAEIA